jgi:hypothetical protein
MSEPKFDPVTSRDYVPELVTGYKQINEGMANYWDQEIDNYNYAASFAGDSLKKLGEMSETVSGILKEREEKKKQEDFAKGYMWFFENGVPDTAMQAYEEGTKELYEEGRLINDMRTQWEASGGDIWNSVGFKELNKAEQHGVVVAFVESKLQQYSPSTNAAMQNATSYEEYKAAESVARLQLYRELGDINPALVNKHLFEGQRKKEEIAYNNWYTERETAIKEEEIIEAKKTLESCALTGVDGVNCIMNYVNNYSGLYGGIRGKARREALSHLKTLVDGGVLKDGHVDQLLDTEYVHDDGHVTTYRKQYKVEANELEDAVIDYEVNKYNKDQTEHQLNAHNETQAFIKSIPADKITEKGYDLTIIKQAQELIHKQKMKYNGYSDPYLTTMIESLRNDKNIIKSRKLDAEKAFLDGELNSETLKEYPIMVQLDTEIQKKAKAGDTVIVDGAFYLEDLEAMVKKAAQVTVGGYDDGANQLTRYFQAEWKARAIELHATLPEDQKHLAGKMAFEEIKNKFMEGQKLGPSQNPYTDDDNNYRPPNLLKKTEIAETSRAVHDSIAKEKKAILEIPDALDVKRMFFSEKELIDMQNESAKLGILVIPEKAKRIAKLYDNINAIDVINRQRAALGMEPLTSNSLKAFDGLPSESKLLLNYSVTGMTSARAWATTGEDNTALNEYPLVLNLFKDDLDFGFKMATYESGLKMSFEGIDLNSKFKVDFDFTNGKTVSELIFENLDKEEQKDFHRNVFKYSGGTDLESLNFLVHEDLKPLVDAKKLVNQDVEEPRPKWDSKKYKNYEEYRQDVLAWRDRNFKIKNKKEIKIYQDKINFLDPKNRNVPNT